MENVKSKRKSLRRQWSVDVPSSIQRKFRQVAVAARRSKSLDEAEYTEKLLGCDEQETTRNAGSFENFGHNVPATESMPSNSSMSSPPWYSFDDETSNGSWGKVVETVAEPSDVQMEENFDGERCSLPTRTKDLLSVNTCGGLLSTIDEHAPRSPTKRASPVSELDGGSGKTGPQPDVPRKFAKNDDYGQDGDDPEIGKRFRRYAICEEMERYITVDRSGQSLRKHRETLIRHRVLKELCLL